MPTIMVPSILEEEEGNYVEAPSWKVRLQVNVALNGSGSKVLISQIEKLV
jgi:hypothetical protein